MFDNANHLFTPIVREAGTAVWAEPTDVRRRGHVRKGRRLIGAGVAVGVVAALGAGSAWAIAGPDRRPPAPGQSASPIVESSTPSEPPTSVPSAPGTSSSSPPATSTEDGPIPEAAMLRGADVGGGYRVSDAREGDDHGGLSMLMSYCGLHRYSASGSHVAVTRKRSFANGDERYVLQEVRRYRPGWAATHLSDLSRALAKCPSVEIGGNPADRRTLTIVASDFAGAGSLLIKEVGTSTQYHAVVRQGDVEARLRIHVPGGSETNARDLARTAATRLCAATPAC